MIDCPYKIEVHDDILIASGPCVVTGEIYTVTCSKEGFYKWRTGTSIQYALPELSDDDRGFLISSISPKGWEKTFS